MSSPRVKVASGDYCYVDVAGLDENSMILLLLSDIRYEPGGETVDVLILHGGIMDKNEGQVVKLEGLTRFLRPISSLCKKVRS